MSDFEPKLGKVRATFFRCDETSRDMVELKIVGDPNSLIRKVQPKDINAYPHEWAAYEAGKGTIEVHGTPLTEIPGVERDAAQRLKLHGVRTVEELASLDEAAAKSIGLGGLTWWKSAKLLLQAKRAEALDALTADVETKRGPGRPRKEPELPAITT
jgi:hypothetical protein